MSQLQNLLLKMPSGLSYGDESLPALVWETKDLQGCVQLQRTFRQRLKVALTPFNSNKFDVLCILQICSCGTDSSSLHAWEKNLFLAHQFNIYKAEPRMILETGVSCIGLKFKKVRKHHCVCTDTKRCAIKMH